MVLFVIALSAYLLQQNSGVKHLSLAVLLIALVQVAVIHEYLRFDIVANFAYPFIFIVVVSSILLLVAPTGSLIEKLLATVFGGAYLTSYLSKSPAILQLIEFDFNAASSEVFQLGEFLAVAGAPLIYLVFRREISATSWRSFFVPSLLAGLFVTAYLLNPWATSTLAMLTLGFSLILPFPIYTIALWLYSFVTLGLLGKRKHVAYGLLLILLAGRNLQSTYLALIAITGLLFTFLPRQKIMPQVSVSTR